MYVVVNTNLDLIRNNTSYYIIKRYKQNKSYVQENTNLDSIRSILNCYKQNKIYMSWYIRIWIKFATIPRNLS